MQIQLNKLVTEIGLMASLGVAFMIVKNKPVRIPTYYSKYIHLSNSGIPIILEKFRQLDQNENHEELCDMINDFLMLSEMLTNQQKINGGQFKMNRLCEQIRLKSREMVYNARHAREVNVQTASIDCERDELPALYSQCKQVLQNVLLT
jgi:signal transduction histidine kinase